MERSRILLVDDDADLRELCSYMLTNAGYRVDSVGDGEAALEHLENGSYELGIFDWHLPGLAGKSLLEVVGWRWPELPIVIMTGYSDEDKAVVAVEYAQAYLRKPFDKQQLLDTVGRVIHRVSALRTGEYPAARTSRASRQAGDNPGHGQAAAAGGGPGVEVRQRGAVEINPLRCEARIGDGPPVALTATEYAVVNHLFVHPGEVVPHKALARLLSDRPLSAKEAAALCKHHIRALRAKLEPDPARPIYIKTVWGQGYRLLPDGG
jgi:DNA-binding response OmpR family regulator